MKKRKIIAMVALAEMTCKKCGKAIIRGGTYDWSKLSCIECSTASTVINKADDCAERRMRKAIRQKNKRDRRRESRKLEPKKGTTQRKRKKGAPTTLRGSYDLREGFLNALAKDR